jgi:hypothetical protein
VRLVAPLEEHEDGTLSALVHGAMIERRPRLEVTRFSPPVELVSPAEFSQRLADSRAPPVGVSGPRRSVALPDLVLTTQTAYLTGDAGHRLADVMVQWGDMVAHGRSLRDAIESASRARAGTSAGDQALLEARRWFERLDLARARGDWVAFGRAYDELRRILGTRLRAP